MSLLSLPYDTNVVDVFILALLLFGMVRGLARGLSGELSRVIADALAVYAAWHTAAPLGDRIHAATGMQPGIARALAFLATFVAVFLAAVLVRIILRKVMQLSFHGSVERFGGLLAGLLRALIYSAALLIFAFLLPAGTVRTFFMEESLSGRTFAPLIPAAYRRLNQRIPALPPLDEHPRAPKTATHEGRRP